LRRGAFFCCQRGDEEFLPGDGRMTEEGVVRKNYKVSIVTLFSLGKRKED